MTILGTMAFIAIVGIILGLFAAYSHDQGGIAVFLIASLVIVVPVHFGIEGNRRDALDAGPDQAGRSDREGSHGSV